MVTKIEAISEKEKMNTIKVVKAILKKIKRFPVSITRKYPEVTRRVTLSMSLGVVGNETRDSVGSPLRKADRYGGDACCLRRKARRSLSACGISL